MKKIKEFILSQVAAGQLSKKDAYMMLRELYTNVSHTVKTDDIAIIGISCRFPKAENKDEFWDNLVNEYNAIEDFPEERKHDVDVPIRDYFKDKKYDSDLKYRRGAYLRNIDKFDADFFNISLVEAVNMDPLQRLFLEETWRALEDAGYSCQELYGSRTGIYVGDTDADYLKLIQNMNPYALPGNTISIIASRISYLLNLSSGSHMIDTACSASLSAVHHAVKGLITGDCDMAVVGGINLTLFPIDEELKDIGIASPDYQARTFDASANGTVWGEGVGVIILKTLEKAKKDNNHIYALIKGSAINSDGKTNGITAPSALAQTDLIKEAWQNAGIDPRTVTYIEVHGTGTKLGDPIEIEGISNAFRAYTDDKQFCAVSSLKTNIGHLDTAAGIAGLIKATLSLKNKKLIPSLHFKEQNPHIELIDSPLYVNTELKEWNTEEGVPRRAGVSAFGLAGTNCHIILEEYQQFFCEKRERAEYIFTLSAKSRQSLRKLIHEYCIFLEDTKFEIADICYTSNVGRGHYEYRLAVKTTDVKQLKECLDGMKKESLEQAYQNGPVYFNYLESKVEEVYEATFGMESDIIISEYMKGKEINWVVLYDTTIRTRISMPVYSFTGKRYWIDYTSENEKDFGEIRNSIDDLFYHLEWKESPLFFDKGRSFIPGGTWVLFIDEEGIGEEIRKLLAGYEQTCITVRPADYYRNAEEDRYFIRPSVLEDYCELFHNISLNTQNICGILHLWTCTEIRSSLHSIDDLLQSQETGILSFFNIMKVFSKPIALRCSRIMMISNYASRVTVDDSYIFPDKSMLLGLARVGNQEIRDICLNCVDIDTIGHGVDETTSWIFSELQNEQMKDEIISAWRNGKRYTQQFARLIIEEELNESVKIQKGKVYIIAGGAGKAGLEICRYLAREAKVHLVIINRLMLPDKNCWRQLEEDRYDETIINRVRELLQIEEMGSEVTYIAQDISDVAKMKDVIEGIKNRYGEINGIINSTMHIHEMLLEDMTIDDFREAIKAKVSGTYLLHEYTKDQNLDFFLLYSSAASYLGGIGLGGYAAANAFMDGFAQYYRRRGLHIMSLNWSNLELSLLDKNDRDDFEDSLVYPINTEDYREIIGKLLRMDCAQITIADINFGKLAKVLKQLKIDFEPNISKILYKEKLYQVGPQDKERVLEAFEELKQMILSKEEVRDILQRDVKISAQFTALEELIQNIFVIRDKPQSEKKKNKPGSIRLTGRTNGIYTITEKRVAQVWGEVLGTEEISLHKDFFEDGDSLLLMSVIGGIRDAFNTEVPIEIFFQEPTIEGISSWIEQQTASSESELIPVLPRYFETKDNQEQ